MRSDYQKIAQALNLVANKCGQGQLNRMKAIKLLYLADRYHIRKYGRPLTGDRYFAMKKGVVGSIARDLTNDSEFLDDEMKVYAQKYLKPVGEHAYKVLENMDPSVFSQTDIEALEFSIVNFGKYNQWDLADLTHVFPEWKKFEKEALQPGGVEAMKYEDFFDDPDENDPLFKKYFPQGDPFKKITNEAAKEIFLEENEQEKLWK